MAIMYPKSIDDTATYGEKQMYNILQRTLPETYHVWFNTRINKKYPDFIILNPELGIIILEVKDWDIRNITHADKKRFNLLSKETKKNPLEQARDYTYLIVNKLKKSKLLIQNDGQYKGNLAFMYGYGVILWNIEQNAFVSKFGNVLDEDFVIFKEELAIIKNDQASMANRLTKMFPSYFVFNPLNNEQIDEIKKNLNGYEHELNIAEQFIPLEPTPKSEPILREEPIILENIKNDLSNNLPTENTGRLKISNSTSVKKICLTLFICILMVIGIYGLQHNENVSPGTHQEQNTSITNTNTTFEYQGYIKQIEHYENGAIRLKLDNGFENQEVYINQELDVKQFQFVLDSEYKFTGKLIEYNDRVQLHPTKLEDITCIQINNFYPVLVTEIVDGDTIYVINENDENIQIRLIGVTCPKLSNESEAGKLASQYTQNMLLNQTVFLEKDISETDIYGRTLRYIWLEMPENRDIENVKSKMFNAKLIIDGYAKIATYPPDTKYEDIFDQL